MGSFNKFTSVCRLCGLECYDLIHLFEQPSHHRNLTAIIKEYLRVKIVVQDLLPHHICGPCVAKLDEVVEFVDKSHATQTKLNSQVAEDTREASAEANEDKLYELMQDVKVELEESENQFIDDLNDEDYDPRNKKKKRRKATRGMRGRGVISRGLSSNQSKKRSKEVIQEIDSNNKEQITTNTATINKDRITTNTATINNKERITTNTATINNKDRITTNTATINNKERITTNTATINNKERITTNTATINKKQITINTATINKALTSTATISNNEEVATSTTTINIPVKVEQWMENHTRKEATTEGNLRQSANSLSSCDQLVSSVKCAVRCGLCKSSFSRLEHLTSHSREVHQVSESSYLCPLCPQIFNKVTSFKNHQRRKHQDSFQKCPECNKAYPVHYLWTRHMLVHTNSRPFSCDECDKKFKSQAELNAHKRLHRPTEERYTHCCEVCGKRFTQKGNLDSHLRLHTGNRPFSCEFCGKCFSQRGNMEEHRRTHTGETPFECDLCGLRYSRQGKLAMHRKQHSGEKPHKCKFCEKEFLRREVLRKHEHMHTNSRPYKCSYCDKSFRDQGKRKVHERLHTGERPYECHFCGRGFCESGNLRKHLRVHQPRPESAASVQDKNHSLPPSSAPRETNNRGSSFNTNPAAHKTVSVRRLTTQDSPHVSVVGDSSRLAMPEPVSIRPVISQTSLQPHQDPLHPPQPQEHLQPRECQPQPHQDPLHPPQPHQHPPHPPQPHQHSPHPPQPHQHPPQPHQHPPHPPQPHQHPSNPPQPHQHPPCPTSTFSSIFCYSGII